MRMLILAIVLMQVATPQQGARTPEDIERETPPGQVIRLAPTPDDPVNDGPVVIDPIPARVEGEVKEPGNYVFNGPTLTFPELIEAAGGFTDKANRHAIALRRGAFPGSKPMTFDYDDREGKGKGLHIWAQGVYAWPGDMIIVSAIEPPAK